MLYVNKNYDHVILNYFYYFIGMYVYVSVYM